MQRAAYDDAIEALARLAIASGNEPTLVCDGRGPQALCSNAASRLKRYAELSSDVGTALLPMPIDPPYDRTIKAFARVAIAAGAQPSRVREKLGPSGLCDTTAARRKPFAQLLAQAVEASGDIGLPINLDLPNSAANAKTLFAQRPELGMRYAEAAIEFGAAVRVMQIAWPQERKRLILDENRAITDAYSLLGERICSLASEINRQVAEIVNSARRGASDLTLMSAAQRVLQDLDRHDMTVRQAYRVASQFRWLSVIPVTPGQRSQRQQMASIRAIRNEALTSSAAVRRWVVDNSPANRFL